jgi:predicted permease
METLRQDAQYAFRGLVRTPGFTAIACLTLAIGTGANATVFSFVDALLFRPARGVEDPSRLIAVYTSDFSSGPYGATSYPDYLSIKEEAGAFSGVAAARPTAGFALIDRRVERLRGAAVTPNYFDVVGLRMERGRTFSAADGAADAAPVAVISDRLWSRLFNADPAALGSALDLNQVRHTIVGIAPPGFEGLNLGAGTEVWTVLQPSPQMLSARGSRGLSLIARLAPDATLEQAQAQLAAIADRLARAYPNTNLGTLHAPDLPRPMMALVHTRMPPQFRAEIRTASAVMMAAALLVLLTACANVSNLLLTRATTRSREMAIRLALGSSRARIVRQLLVETLLLAAAGAAAGLLLAMWLADALPSFFPPEQARLVAAGVDARVIAFSLLLAGAASLIFGLAPALQALRPSAIGALRGEAGPGRESPLGARLRRGFVVLQVAMAFVLLASAGLLVRSLRNSMDADLGFGTRSLVLATVEMRPGVLEFHGRVFFREGLSLIRALPGVESASLVASPPLTRASRRDFAVRGYQPRPGEDMELPFNIVEPAYFEAMRIPVLAGRTFDERDTATSARVAIVNEIVAMRYFNGNAVGERISDAPERELEIIGIVPAGAYLSVQDPPAPMVYYPLSQAYSGLATFVARAAVRPESLVEPIARGLRGLQAPGIAVTRTTTMDGHLGEVMAGDRITAALVGACGVLALGLAMIGVYGVVSYSVVLRTHEIGVRVALGARHRDVIRLVLSEGFKLTIAGAALGAVMAFGATRLLGSMLYLVSPTDPATFVLVPTALAFVGLAATWIPVRRALRVQPMIILRQE